MSIRLNLMKSFLLFLSLCLPLAAYEPFISGPLMVYVTPITLSSPGVEYPSVILSIHTDDSSTDSFTVILVFERDGVADSRNVKVQRNRYNSAQFTSVEFWLNGPIAITSFSVEEHKKPATFRVTR